MKQLRLSRPVVISLFCGVVAMSLAAFALSVPSIRSRLHLGGPKAPDLAAARARVAALAGEDEELPLREARVVIHKAERKAELFAGDRLIKAYRFGLGREPAGAKSAQGDNRTPEGAYRICTRLTRSQYHLFLGLNYPNAADGGKALKAGRIGEKEAEAFARSEARKAKPDWETAMGGAIGLHGGGAGSDWTLGCVAFENVDIEELFVATGDWTEVEILP